MHLERKQPQPHLTEVTICVLQFVQLHLTKETIGNIQSIQPNLTEVTVCVLQFVQLHLTEETIGDIQSMQLHLMEKTAGDPTTPVK